MGSRHFSTGNASLRTGLVFRVADRRRNPEHRARLRLSCVIALGFTKEMKPLYLAVLVMLWIGMASVSAASGLVQSGFLYTEAPFPSCHASTIAETSEGKIVAAWFGGTDEGNKDVGIWFSENGSDEWSAPREVAHGIQSDGERFPCWNPVLFQPRKGPLLLFYKVGPSPSRWWGMLMTSPDGGRTWSPPRRLPEGILGPIKNKPVELENGDLLCPTSSEHAGWRVHFEITPDLGYRWLSSGPVNDGKEFGAIQPSILLHGGKRLQALGRTRQGRVFEIWSEDNGKTWGPMTATSLPNPNAGTDAVTLKDGRHMIVYNHTRKGRTPLNVAVSGNGREWEAALVLEAEAGEYSYPAVIQSRDGRVHITYTWKRQRIKHAVLDPDKLEGKPVVEGIWPE